MKILLPAVSSSTTPDGVTRHAANVAQCLLLLPEIERVDVIVGHWQYDAMRSMLGPAQKRLQLSIAETSHSALSRNLWFWSRLPRHALALRSDIVHATYPVPLHRSAFPCPLVVTLHDLYPYDMPSNFGFPKVLLNRAILRQSLWAAHSIACVSESTRHRLQVHAPTSVLDKAITIHNSVSPLVSAITCPVPNWRGEPFLLCVAQHRRNKNILLAIEVFKRLYEEHDLPPGARLVLVGAEGPETSRIRRFITRHNLANRVILLRDISEAELAWCYTRCEFLLAPSTIEGFGLPIVEAMLRQCHVVCSDIPAFREVGGHYVHYADLQHDPAAAFVRASRLALESHTFRAPITDRFLPSRIAEDYRRLYQHLLHAHSVHPCFSSNRAPHFERGQS